MQAAGPWLALPGSHEVHISINVTVHDATAAVQAEAKRAKQKPFLTLACRLKATAMFRVMVLMILHVHVRFMINIHHDQS